MLDTVLSTNSELKKILIANCVDFFHKSSMEEAEECVQCTKFDLSFEFCPRCRPVNSSQPLAAGDFDRLMLLPATFHEPAQLLAIDPSLLLVHICGTIYHFISVTLNYRFPSFAGY